MTVQPETPHEEADTSLPSRVDAAGDVSARVATDSVVPLPVVVPDAPPIAAEVFGDRLERALAYAELLVTAGAVRGIVGPREAPRVWDRHVLNCAVIAPSLPPGATVTDIGSGGGLPGLVLALARPDCTFTLVDSMARRTEFLQEAVELLGLGAQVSVVRGRAEEMRRRDGVVTARAVADPVRLARWATGLIAPGGRLLALVGATAADQRADWLPRLQKSGWRDVRVEERALSGVSPTWVLSADRR